MRSAFISTQTRLIRPVYSHSIQTQTRPVSHNPTHIPKTPLFLWPVTHSATVSDINKFLNWAHTYNNNNLNAHTTTGQNCITDNKHYKNVKNDLDPLLLSRELNWLLQDTFENHNLTLQIMKSDTLVPLRTSLDNLYMLWEERVEKRRPFQYIVGCEHWRDLVLSVEEGVLIPRPETELVVDLVSGLVEGNAGFFGEGVWGDLGTGSGALGIGIGRVLVGNGRVVATDLSNVAVGVARYNVERYNLEDKVEVRMGSWFEPLKDVEGELVGLVSNPPYIPTAHIPGLQAEVAKHEPILALDGGANGMDDLLHLCNGAASMLKPGGFFIFETNGETQCKFLVEYMRNKFRGSFCDLKIVLDFAGKQRFVTGYRAL